MGARDDPLPGNPRLRHADWLRPCAKPCSQPPIFSCVGAALRGNMAASLMKNAFPRAVCLVVLCAAFLPAFSHAGLKWDSTLARAEGVAGQDVVSVEFRFRNDGKEAATISSVHPRCDCTRATVAKTQYAPGESGVVVVSLSGKGHGAGYLSKIIEVREQGAKSPTLLTLAVHLVEPLALSVRALEWKKGETAEKAVEISPREGVKIDEVKITSDSFEARNEDPTAARRTVTVRPRTADKGISALLRVRFSGRASGEVSIPLSIK